MKPLTPLEHTTTILESAHDIDALLDGILPEAAARLLATYLGDIMEAALALRDRSGPLPVYSLQTLQQMRPGHA